jgi:hypothetical protein
VSTPWTLDVLVVVIEVVLVEVVGPGLLQCDQTDGAHRRRRLSPIRGAGRLADHAKETNVTNGGFLEATHRCGAALRF